MGAYLRGSRAAPPPALVYSGPPGGFFTSAGSKATAASLRVHRPRQDVAEELLLEHFGHLVLRHARAAVRADVQQRADDRAVPAVGGEDEGRPVVEVPRVHGGPEGEEALDRLDVPVLAGDVERRLVP